MAWQVVLGAVATASAVGWLWLLLLRGGFYRVRPRLPPAEDPEEWPPVVALVPARNEADVLPHTLPSLLRQDYPGPFHVVLVDDESRDGTGHTARETARRVDREDLLTVVRGVPLPPGWAGKVWALHQGLQRALEFRPGYLWLTDADVEHSPDVLRALMCHARRGHDLVSVMARLEARTWWERLLLPAFVYYFAMLYPFAWTSDPGRRTAGSAGGCVLVRAETLRRMGGFEAISGALIDDCALARRVKDAGGRLWLGYHDGVVSRRDYRGLPGVWRMVSRSAYYQLRHSPLLLLGTVLGMALLFLGHR